MIKRTLYFGNPAYLRFNVEQLEVSMPEASMLPSKNPSITVVFISKSKIQFESKSQLGVMESDRIRDLFLAI
jgi:hypothetical protein